jgi:hypothetical protein
MPIAAVGDAPDTFEFSIIPLADDHFARTVVDMYRFG